MPGYISEVKWANAGTPSFVEIAVPAGTDTSGYTIVEYFSNGSVDTTYSFGAIQSTFGDPDVYTISNTPTGSFVVTGTSAFALVDNNGNVLQFISQNGNSVTATQGPASGHTSQQVPPIGGTNSAQSDDGGATYYQQTSPNPGAVPAPPPCYSLGTMIDTPDGPRAVETLRAGDLVSTLDHGPQEIRWVRSGDHPLEDAEVDDKPVLIHAGALGKGLPAQDLIVSPQHRILVGGHQQLQGSFETEAFAPAKALTSLRGIRHMNGKTKITWVHFACERHEVVTANGCLSESLLLGPIVVNGLTAAERQVVIDIFGPAATPGAALNGQSARECLKVGAVHRQLSKSLNVRERIVASEIKKWDVDAAMEQYEAEHLREAKEPTHGFVKASPEFRAQLQPSLR